MDSWVSVFRLALALLRTFKHELMISTDIAFVAQFFHSLKDKTERMDIHQLLFKSLQFDGLTDSAL
jgi:hypothetical protein